MHQELCQRTRNEIWHSQVSHVQLPIVVQRAHSVLFLQTQSYKYQTFSQMDLYQNNVYVQKLIVISILIYYFENFDLKVIAVFTQGQKNYKIHK